MIRSEKPPRQHNFQHRSNEAGCFRFSPWDRLLLASLILFQGLFTSAWQAPADPWAEAVAEAQALLHSHPQFEDNLRSYASLAERLDQSLASLEQAAAALNTIEQLKSMQLPLLGNAWDALRQALDSAVPGAGAALEALDEGLRRLQRLRGVLDDMPAVERTAEAVRAFRQSPSPDTLRSLADTCPASVNALESLRREIAEPLAQLDGVLHDIETAQHALSGISGLVGLGEAVGQIERAVEMAAQPVYELRSGLSTLQRQVESDLEVLREIEQIVARAGHPVAGGIGGGGGMLGLVLAALAAAGAAAYWLSRRRPTAAAAPSAPIRAPAPAIPQPAPPMEAVRPGPWLTAESGPLAGQRLALTKACVILGRGSQADLRLLDPTVSRKHAQLRLAQDAWFIQNLASTGGTFHNGQRVQASRLRSGDRITIGSSTFLFTE